MANRKDDLEVRTFRIEVRKEDQADRPELRGYAAVFGSLSEDLGGFREMIAPGAFASSLKDENRDLFAFLGHNSSTVLGRRSNGTLELREDKTGLLVRITPPDTQAGRDVVSQVRDGYLDKMSFGFRVPESGDEWPDDLKADGLPVRVLRNVELFEVSIVAMPAYSATKVSARALEAAKAVEQAPAPATDEAKARTRAEAEAEALNSLEAVRLELYRRK